MAVDLDKKDRPVRVVQGLGSILGQDPVLDFLFTGIDSARLAHALLMTGPQGVGKHSTALALAQALNCPEAPGRGCGTCNTCSRILRGVHPDVLVVEPDGRWIKIDQVRALESRVEGGPHEANTLVVIFDPADRMNAAAANALLKSLEEPKRSVLFCLVTSAPHAVLPTVRSRCQSLRFAPLADEQLLTLLERRVPDALENLDEAARGRIVALSEGSLGRAVELASDERFGELLAFVDRTMRAARDPFDPISHFVFAGELADLGAELERLLSMLAFEVRRRTRAALLVGSESETLGDDGAELSVKVTTRWYAALERARARFRANANRKLLCETLLLDMTGESRRAGS